MAMHARCRSPPPSIPPDVAGAKSRIMYRGGDDIDSHVQIVSCDSLILTVHPSPPSAKETLPRDIGCEAFRSRALVATIIEYGPSLAQQRLYEVYEVTTETTEERLAPCPTEGRENLPILEWSAKL
ncbi:hypothetical protein VTH06DRAFT_712 [Thermothelomyces fergusii]